VFTMNRQELQKKVKQIVHQLAYEKGYVSPVDMLLNMEKITPKLVEEWRFGRVPYLERVMHGNLSQLNFILGEFREVARDLGLQESQTSYKSWGKGPKRTLRFSKSGDNTTERRYSTHYVKPKKLGESLIQLSS
jgi:hypothetical protein